MRSRKAIVVAAIALAVSPAAGKPARSKKIYPANGSNMPRGFTWPPSQTMRDAAATCEQGLRDLGVAWHKAGNEGHIVDAVTIDDFVLGGIAYKPTYASELRGEQVPLGYGKPPHKLDCQLALALAQIGPTLYAAGVREVRFGSIYRWSKIRVGGKTRNALSRHALGLAMDIAAFVDAEGHEANVSRDYNHGDPLLLAVEHAINDDARAFRKVLTPKNDPLSHHDHFHIEANPNYAAPAPRS